MALANSNINPGTACAVDVIGCFVTVAGGYLTDNGHQTPVVAVQKSAAEMWQGSPRPALSTTQIKA